MREQIHHETVTPAEWLFCSDGLLPCFRDNETGIRNGPAFFQQARRAPLHGSPLQPACQTAGSPTGRPPRHPQQRSPTSRPRGGQRRSPTSQQPPTTGGAAPTSRPPRDRSRNGGQTGMAATRRAAVPCALVHTPPEPPRPAVLSHNSPELPRPAALSHNSPEPPPLCALLHKPAGPPGARRPPPPGKARTSSPGARRPLPSGKREPRPRRAPLRMPDRYIRSVAGPPGARRPLPSGKREPRPQLAPLRMPDRYIRSVAGPPGARRFAAEGGWRAAENIFFLIPEYPLTTA